MTNIIILALAGLCLVLIFTIVMYRRQINSICRQLRVHRSEESGTDIWLDYIQGPFGKLQRELNEFIREKRQEKAAYTAKENAWKQMIANVSHDIRTPITSISGYFQLLNETEDPEKRAEYVRIIRGRLDEFTAMLEEFFVYSASTSDDRKPSIESCNISRCVTESLFLYYDDIEKKLGSVKLDFPEKDVIAYAEEATLKRVFQNIIKNALTHGSGDFRVRLAAFPEKVTIIFENKTEEKLPENPNDVFERTYRADPARSTKGTGLGLCIAKEFTEKMGGSINALCIGDDTFRITIVLKASKI
ncbi:Signal transduction histidine kinase [Lachnospiraceae bacterium G11]|nr:Signal transduction histidine kinase [Lachnospiraceae bacterium G11]